VSEDKLFYKLSFSATVGFHLPYYRSTYLVVNLVCFCSLH